MAIEKMELVSIRAKTELLDDVLEKCCDSGCFQLESATGSTGTGERALQLMNDKNPYDVPAKGLASLATELGIELRETDYTKCGLDTAEEFTVFLNGIERSLAEASKRRQDALATISERRGAVIQIDHLTGLNEDFSRIFSCKHVHVKVGKLPIENREKLEYYDENFFFVPFEHDKNFWWGMYFCPKESKEIVDDIFRTMYFEQIHIPEYVQGNTSEAVERLNADIKENEAIVKQAEEELSRFTKKHEDDIQRAYSKLNRKRAIFELHRKVGVLRGNVYIKGFIPRKKKEKFSELFKGMEDAAVTFMPPDTDSGCTPPTILKNTWFSKPYRMLVEMYGVPDYNGSNPTAFVAITYTLMFGIMFGDLGQGFLVWLLGLFIGAKVHKQLGGMMTRCGFSSMVFGTLFGSVFGFEDLLDPVFEGAGIDFLPLHPFENSNFILIASVGLGIALILVSMIKNIINGFREHNYEKAVFGNNGIAGLVFYGSIIAGVVASMMFDVKIMSGPFVLCFIVIPLICIFCRVPFAAAIKYKELRLSEDGEKMTVGNFIVENFFEMFEYLLSYVSNTVSFLRVGGFVLSHAGMMLVVKTLMDMTSATGKPIVCVLGNAFVMVMEGMIVAIQIIRLEFYEVFSRFYNGDGKSFEPLKIEFSSQID